MQSTKESFGLDAAPASNPPEAGELQSLPGVGALARRYLQTLFSGWWALGAAGLRSLGTIAGKPGLVEILFMLGCLGIVATTLLFPWIVYDVNLLAPEIAGRGSNYRILFFLPGPLGLLLYAIGVQYRLPIFYAVGALVGLLYLAGILWPNPVHTLMRDPADYRFHISMLIYGGSLALAAATAWQALRSHLVTPGAIRAYLLEPRAPTEELNPPRLREYRRDY
ncbi:MAG: hypothetical protein RIF32_22725 [Leptospirales bacterium]|jgi:hypothetical protein